MSWLQNGNEVLLTSPVSMTEITGLRNTRYTFIFNLIIANPGATVPINATINDRVLSNEYSYKTISTNGTIFNEMTIIDGGSGPFDQTASATVWGSRT